MSGHLEVLLVTLEFVEDVEDDDDREKISRGNETRQLLCRHHLVQRREVYLHQTDILLTVCPRRHFAFPVVIAEAFVFHLQGYFELCFHCFVGTQK